MIDLSRGCLSRLVSYLWFCMFWGIFRHKLCLRCFTLIIMSVTCQKGWHLKAMTKRTFLAELSFRTWHHADSSLQWSCTAQEVFDGDIDGESSEESPKFTEGFDYLYPLSTQWVMESLTICHLIHLHHQHLPACLWLTMFFYNPLTLFCHFDGIWKCFVKTEMKAPLLKAMLHVIMLRRSCFHFAGSKWHNKAKRNVHLIHDALAVELMEMCLKQILLLWWLHHTVLFRVKTLFE